MILNASNSKTIKSLTNSAFIDDWQNVRVTVYVDPSVRFGRELVEGLRISPKAPAKRTLTPNMAQAWKNAKAAYKRDGNLDQVLVHVDIASEHQTQLISECAA